MTDIRRDLKYVVEKWIAVYTYNKQPYIPDLYTKGYNDAMVFCAKELAEYILDDEEFQNLIENLP